MALARPIRAMLLAAVLLWCSFIYIHILTGPSSGILSKGENYLNFEREPTLDRETSSDGWMDGSIDGLTIKKKCQ
jgi:hypothetical protein